MALVALLSDPKPNGLDLEYDWSISANAKLTLERGKGDCVALATVLIGLGRSLGWPMYFAEARAETPVVHDRSFNTNALTPTSKPLDSVLTAIQ